MEGKTMQKTRVKVDICSSTYVILTDESETYTKALGREIDRCIKQFLDSNPGLTPLKAAVPVLMDYCDKTKKLESLAENIKKQLRNTIEALTKSQLENDKLRSDNEKLKSALYQAKKDKPKPSPR
jgi:cell division protein ZapA